MARPRQPEPEPLPTNDVHVAVAGTVAWLIALAVLLIVGLSQEHRWWLWVCVTGAVIGLFAAWYTPRLQRARATAEARQAVRDQEILDAAATLLPSALPEETRHAAGDADR